MSEYIREKLDFNYGRWWYVIAYKTNANISISEPFSKESSAEL